MFCCNVNIQFHHQIILNPSHSKCVFFPEECWSDHIDTFPVPKLKHWTQSICKILIYTWSCDSSCWCPFLLFSLVGCYPALVWQKLFSSPLHWWDSCSRLEKVSVYNLLMEKANAAVFCVLMITFMWWMWRSHGWSAWSGFLDVDKCKVSGFQT
jgi:hypothetical protein